MRDPGAWPEPREQPGYNGASSTRPTDPASPPGAGGLGLSPDADREAALPENPPGSAEKHAHRAPRATRKRAAETSVEPRRTERKRYLDAKPAESVAGQLVDGFGEQRAANSSREPGTRQVATPGQQDRTEGRSQPQTQPEQGDPGAAPVLYPAVADARGPDRCAVVYKGSRGGGEFEVVVTENGASRRCVARSPEFRPPWFGAVRRWGAARVAHELVILRLAACGWWSVDSGGGWHELQFVRARPVGMRTRRSLVTVIRDGGQARFVAEELDAYGNPTPLMVSPAFSAPRFRFLSVRPSRQARRSLEQLVGRMEAEDWEVAAPVGNNWYAISLWRPVKPNGDPHGPRSDQGRPAPERA
jgi:hypothetical protein